MTPGDEPVRRSSGTPERGGRPSSVPARARAAPVVEIRTQIRIGPEPSRAPNATRRPSWESAGMPARSPSSSIETPAGSGSSARITRGGAEVPEPEPRPNQTPTAANANQRGDRPGGASRRRDATGAGEAGAAAGTSPRISRSSARRASPISRRRSFGSRSRQRSSRPRSAGGVPAGSRRQSISWRITAARVSEAVSPSNSRRPVTISNSTTPKAQMSPRRSTALPLACSGAM